MNRCDELRLELGGYVLDGLEPDEVAEVEAHVASCERCRLELDRLGDLPELLGEAWDVPPRAPTDLRARVLNSVRPSMRRRRVPAVVAAAMAVVAAVIGAVTVSVVDRPPPADVVLALQGQAAVGMVGEAALTQVPAGVQVDLALQGVQEADEGYYHVWLHRDEVRVSAGTFVGPDDGRIDVTLLCGGWIEAYDRLTVTWHPFDEPDEIVAIDASFAASSDVVEPGGDGNTPPASPQDGQGDPWGR